jgi:hypothetical protein
VGLDITPGHNGVECKSVTPRREGIKIIQNVVTYFNLGHKDHNIFSENSRDQSSIRIVLMLNGSDFGCNSIRNRVLNV